jgi:actin-like ATPase involved in cell morphogenesis
MLHDFLRRSRRRGSPLRPNALVCVPSGATPVERRSIIAALSVRRPRYHVRLIDEPVAAALEPIVSAIAASVHEMLSEIPAGLAEDVVRGKVRLAGGGSLLPGLASRIETAAGIGTVLVEDPLRCVIRGAAEMLERKAPEQDKRAGPGLRQ